MIQALIFFILGCAVVYWATRMKNIFVYIIGGAWAGAAIMFLLLAFLAVFGGHSYSPPSWLSTTSGILSGVFIVPLIAINIYYEVVGARKEKAAKRFAAELQQQFPDITGIINQSNESIFLGDIARGGRVSGVPGADRSSDSPLYIDGIHKDIVMALKKRGYVAKWPYSFSPGDGKCIMAVKET